MDEGYGSTVRKLRKGGVDSLRFSCGEWPGGSEDAKMVGRSTKDGAAAEVRSTGRGKKIYPVQRRIKAGRRCGCEKDRLFHRRPRRLWRRRGKRVLPTDAEMTAFRAVNSPAEQTRR